ncbi:MAG: Cell shape-determining protein MreC [Thermoanaerobacterales bacterium 50_218]|nr:MAG: Cell shape-determining protein MreC [Thermoanaerobacterales bacterium 50_218]
MGLLRGSLFRKNLVVVCAVVLLCCLSARFTAEYKVMQAFPNVFQEVLSPVQRGIVVAWQGITSVFSYFTRIQHLREENEQLKQQVRELTWENNRLREYVYENRRLLRLLEFKEHYAPHFTLLGARVIGRSPDTWNSTLILDRGKADGIRLNQVVVADEGLVGRIIAVNTHCSQVLLILDREGAVGAMVQESRTVGVVEGCREKPHLLRMIHLPYDAKLEKGQVVITSGFGGIYPRGIPIGEVVEMESEGSEIDKYALVRPFVDFDRLEEVFIITEIHEVPESLE